MTRTLPKDNVGTRFIQWRGRQTSVIVDEFHVHFGTESRTFPDGTSCQCHRAVPVIDPDADDEDDEEDRPSSGVLLQVAERLVESNPNICFGVVCEHPDPDSDGICGDVFETPRKMNSHQSKHSDSATDDSADDDTDQ